MNYNRPWRSRLLDWSVLPSNRKIGQFVCAVDDHRRSRANSITTQGFQRQDGLDGFRIPRKNHFLGRWISHGGFWPDPKLAFFAAEPDVLKIGPFTKR